MFFVLYLFLGFSDCELFALLAVTIYMHRSVLLFAVFVVSIIIMLFFWLGRTFSRLGRDPFRLGRDRAIRSASRPHGKTDGVARPKHHKPLANHSQTTRTTLKNHSQILWITCTTTRTTTRKLHLTTRNAHRSTTLTQKRSLTNHSHKPLASITKTTRNKSLTTRTTTPKPLAKKNETTRTTTRRKIPNHSQTFADHSHDHSHYIWGRSRVTLIRADTTINHI